MSNHLKYALLIISDLSCMATFRFNMNNCRQILTGIRIKHFSSKFKYSLYLVKDHYKSVWTKIFKINFYISTP